MSIVASCNNPPQGTINIPYDHFLTVSGLGPGETVTWTIVAGMLPPGLTLNSSTGEISGTPTSAGTWTFTVSVDINRALINSAILKVTTSQAASITANPFNTGSLVSANGHVNLFRTLLSLDNANGGGVYAPSWPPTTNSIDVLAGGAVTAYPELKFDPTDPSLIYPVELYQAWSNYVIPPVGVIDLNVRAIELDVTRVGGATGTLIPRSVSVGGTSSAENYVLNADDALDSDPATYATIHRSSIGDVWGAWLDFGTTGWYAPGDHDEITCSITIIGPGPLLDLWVWRELFRFEGLTQQIVFPPGYVQALRLQLAVDFGRSYPGHDLTKIKAQLQSAVERIDNENVSNEQAVDVLPPPPPEQA